MSRLYRVVITRYVTEDTEVLVRADSAAEVQAATRDSESPVITHADNTASWDGDTTDIEVLAQRLDESKVPHLDRLPVLDLTKR